MFRILLNKYVIRSQICLNCTELHVNKTIKIPNKIYRTELSVLKALANCVEFGGTGAPLHCLIDEPWLYPSDYSLRKRFMLSKASGKLSARMAFNDIKHEFIKVALDEPKVKCLLPLLSPTDITKKVEAGDLSIEKGLQLITNLLKPKEAWEFYEANKSTVFSQSTLQSVLELFCATAGSEMNFDIPPEELYFVSNEPVQWRLDNLAELVFHSLPEKTRSAYEAMIRGASKFQNPSRAWELFLAFRQKFPEDFPARQTCDSLLRSLHYLDCPDDSQLEQYIMEILQGMSNRKIAPSVITFNNAIFAFRARKNMDFVEQLYQEMLALNIEPSLGTYAILLRCNFPKVYLLNLARDVVQIVEDRAKTIDFETIISADDCDLFRVMMELFRSTSGLELALRLHKVTMTGGRIHLLDSDAKRGNYSDNFAKLLLLCSVDDLALVLARVRELVPHYYIMQPSTVVQLIDQAKKQRAYRLIPTLIDIVNWNNRRHVETDSFGRILELLLEATDFDADALGNDLARSLEKLLESTRMRRESALSSGSNALMAIDVVARRIGNQRALLWRYVDFAVQQRSMTAVAALPLVQGAVRWQEWTHIDQLLAHLADISVAINSDDPDALGEARAMRQIVRFCNDAVVPLLDKNGVDPAPIVRHLAQCSAAADAIAGRDGEDSSSSSSSSSSDTSDDDDDRRR